MSLYPQPEHACLLIVDDDPTLLAGLHRSLTDKNWEIVSATDPQAALRLLDEHPVDVVISDMGMGAGMNGWELADAVKRRWPSVRFLLATGWGAAIDPGEARAKGVAVVLAKPYHPAELMRALAPTAAAA